MNICDINGQIREIPLQGTYNFRDIGGYRTKDGRTIKWGKIYRSAMLSELTSEDLQIMEALKIKLIIDFRGPIEINCYPDRMPAGACYKQLPAGSEYDEPDNWADLAKDMKTHSEKELDQMAISYYTNIASFKDRYKPVFDSLLDLSKEDALVIHCMGGKDRTGIAAALIEYALGIDLKQIIEDYELSNLYREKYNAEIANLLFLKYGVPEKTAATYGQAKPAFLEATFMKIQKEYGSIDSFLRIAMGLNDEKIAKLKEMYLE
jgi:protein-tyrosine phosphatase